MNKEVRNEFLFNALLKVAVSEALQNELDTLPSNEELNKKYMPSSKLDGRIKKIIHQSKVELKAKHYLRMARKIASLFIIMVVLLFITLLSVEATRNIIFNAFIYRYGEYAKIQFQYSATDSKKNNIYCPIYIPEGFKEKSTQTYGNTVILRYSNNAGTEILFKQRPAESGTSLIDNENTNYKEVIINGNPAYLFEATTKNDHSVLLWQADGLVFELTSQISMEELINIGNSIKNN